METLEKIEVYEVSDDGSIIENYLWDAYEINEAISEGRYIIQFGWQDRLFEPRWGFEQEKWVEGLSNEEVRQREQEIIERENEPTELEKLKQENEMLAMAVMELSTFMLNGGK